MIPKHIKRQAFDKVLSLPFLGNYNQNDGIVSFLGKIWDLRSMPSEDSRYKDAEGDAYQHLVNNDDWTIVDTFLNRFRLIDGEEKFFITFVELVVSPEVRLNKDDIELYVVSLNSILSQATLKLVVTDYFENLPIYKIKEGLDAISLPANIIANSIPFYTVNYKGERKYPCFQLSFRDWDDYGTKSKFFLSYGVSENNFEYIGDLKIIKKNESETVKVLPTNFDVLSKEFCSLGQSNGYYNKIKSLFGNKYQSILLALRDSALFPKIAEEFENDGRFINSLIRLNTAEKTFRTVRFELAGINFNERFRFNYNINLPYASNNINLSFHFEENLNWNTNRVYALIGKNGSGKTTFLSALANELSLPESKNISPHKPLFAKIFTISYSFFDHFRVPEPNLAYNYSYCGLKKSDGIWLTEIELKQRFFESVDIIKKRELNRDWYKTLKSFLTEDLLGIVFNDDQEFDANKFTDFYKQLSSGQNILLFVLTEVIAQIRFNSLILFDEPETHLHPNAISQLMNTIFKLTEKFESFCIIGTHSPLVVQEIPSRNVIIIERTENTAQVRHLEQESFGENLTVITEEVFGRRDINKYHSTLLKNMILNGKSYDDIISHIETDEVPISLNLRLFIKALIQQKQ
ncbi:MAG: AAA family ATPase [Bacteroidales bacterium]|nr:AAA family ATPase [Bacteroidales bacterium]